MGEGRRPAGTARGSQWARTGFVVSVLAFGLIGLFVRRIPLPARDIALWRGVIAFVVLSFFMPFAGRWQALRAHRDQLWKILLAGAAMGFNWVLLFEAYRHTTVAIATLCYYLMPTLLVLAGALWFKERLNLVQVVCFLLATLGLVLIVLDGATGGGGLAGILYGLGAAVLYATVVLFNRATPGLDGISRTWLQFSAAVLAILPYILLTGGLAPLPPAAADLLMLGFVGAVNTGLLYALYFTVMPLIRAQQAAILSYLDPLVAVLVSFFALGEPLGFLQMVGGALILGSTLVNEVAGSRPSGKTGSEPVDP